MRVRASPLWLLELRTCRSAAKLSGTLLTGRNSHAADAFSPVLLLLFGAPLELRITSRLGPRWQ